MENIMTHIDLSVHTREKGYIKEKKTFVSILNKCNSLSMFYQSYGSSNPKNREDENWEVLFLGHNCDVLCCSNIILGFVNMGQSCLYLNNFIHNALLCFYFVDVLTNWLTRFVTGLKSLPSCLQHFQNISFMNESFMFQSFYIHVCTNVEYLYYSDPLILILCCLKVTEYTMSTLLQF